MKANKLMIGDKVRYSGRIIAVTAIYDFENTYRINQDHITIGSVYGIPLTAEILEKNGFEKHIEKGPYFDYYHTYKGFTIFNSRVWHQCIFTSVHELQHALRLCGLTKLADNFKVE